MEIAKRFIYAGVLMGLFSWLKRKSEPQPVELAPLNIKPGPWFRYYLSDWMDAHGVLHNDFVTSGIVTGEVTGDYIWVTCTPEWDRNWFNSKGFQFPAKWVEHKYMDRVVGEDGGSALMPGL